MSNDALLTDLKLKRLHAEALSIYRAQRSQKREVFGGRSRRTRDFVTVSGRDNLAQAVIVRLLTPRGELTALAHPDYGSRLPELIGAQRTETTRNLAKLFVIEALKQERRIEKIIDVTVADQPGERHQINIFIQIQPIDDAQVVDLGPFTLDLG
ncbi:MAG: GPW/gp25 family protein [Gammaproteobacteria bacterium]|nr:GPW/gp25 family protein [Gammaproteobacteria bacterium]MCP4386917.1 GPW/gp25 family protein [Gammaproteobacteria bacterium]